MEVFVAILNSNLQTITVPSQWCICIIHWNPIESQSTSFHFTITLWTTITYLETVENLPTQLQDRSADFVDLTLSLPLTLLLSTVQREVLLKPSQPQDGCNICFCFVATNSTQKPCHTLSINLWRKLEVPCGLIALFIIHTAAIFAPNDAEPCVKNKAPPTSSNPLASFLFEESLWSLPPSGVRASKLPSWGISDVLSVAKYFTLSASGTCKQ